MKFQNDLGVMICSKCYIKVKQSQSTGTESVTMAYS